MVTLNHGRSRLAVAATALLLLLAGCGDTETGSYKTYSELDDGDRPLVDGNATEGPLGAGAPSSDGNPVVAVRPRDSVSGDEPAGNSAGGSVRPAVPIEAPRAGSADAGTATGRVNGAILALDARSPSQFRPDALIGDPSSAPAAKKPDPSKPREIKLLVPEKKFRVEGPEGALRVTYDDINLLQVLNMEPVPPDAPKYFPEWLNELDGKRIRIRGFMSPAFQATGLSSFLLGRDNQACCFPGRAKIYDLFPVKMREGETTDYIQNRPFDVVGVFHIKPWVEDGELYRLYQITDAIVIE